MQSGPGGTDGMTYVGSAFRGGVAGDFASDTGGGGREGGLADGFAGSGGVGASFSASSITMVGGCDAGGFGGGVAGGV